MKKLFILVAFFAMLASFAQNYKTGINTTNPRTSLEISKSDAADNQAQGLLLPQLTDAEITAMQNVPEGLMVFNTTKKCVSIWGKRSPEDATLQWSCLYQTSTSSGSSGFVNVI